MKLNHYLVIISLLVSSLSFSQSWTGNVSSDWNNPANWSSWPLNGEDITIDPNNYSGAGVNPIISVNSTFSPALVLITNGGQLTINANLSTTDHIECLGVGSSIHMTNGIVNVAPGNGGRLIIDLGATMILDNGTLNVDERFIAGENALITINGGTATSGERLLMDLGGRFIQNGGNVSVAAVFAMADGSLTQPSGYTLNDGSLNITGEFGIECEAGNFEPFFLQNGGSLAINGDMFWLGVAPGSGRGHFIMTSGTASVSGIIQNMVGTTLNMQFELHNDALFNMNGILFENQLISDSLVQTGNSVLSINNSSSSIINMGVVDCISGNTLVNGNCSLQGTGNFQFDNIATSLSGILNHITASDIQIKGNIINDGNYVHQNHKIVTNGADQQITSGNNLLLINDWGVENTGSGISLSTTVTVEGALDLVNGLIMTSVSDILKLTSTASSSTGNLGSYVSGPIEKEGNTPFVFPLGKNGKWARLGMSAPALVQDVFRAEYFNTPYVSLSPVSSPLNGISGLEYWSLEQPIGNSDVYVDLHWENASQSGISNCNELSMGSWNGSAWVNEIAAITGSCTANGSGYASSTNPITPDAILTFGFYNNVTNQTFNICNGDFITVGSNNYSTSGIYVDVLQDINMNDSVVITNLNVTVPDPLISYNADILTANDQTADSYSWIKCETSSPTGVTTSAFTPTQSGIYALAVTKNGCPDTSACVYYTLIDTTVSNGESVSAGGTSYSNAGTYTGLLSASDLSDSLVVLNMAVTSVDTSVTQSGITLTSNNLNAFSFQWYDCNSTSSLSGETNNSFVPSFNGSFAVIIETAV